MYVCIGGFRQIHTPNTSSHPKAEATDNIGKLLRMCRFNISITSFHFQAVYLFISFSMSVNSISFALLLFQMVVFILKAKWCYLVFSRSFSIQSIQKAGNVIMYSKWQAGTENCMLVDVSTHTIAFQACRLNIVNSALQSIS